MKKFVSLIFVALLPMLASLAANAQELTVSDIEFIDVGYNDEPPVIILTKEGPALHVHIMNYSAHPDTEEFVITPKISDGSDGEPCSVSIGVSYINYSYTAVITTFNVSFNVYGIEANSFYFSCWWYEGMVSLTEGEPLELWENKNLSKDGVIYALDNKTKTATLSSGRYVEGEYNIPSELDYGGQTFLLTSIDYPAFAFNTSLTSVIIPKSVTNIGNAVFYRCSNLSDVYCYAKNVPETGINMFKDCPIASATLHVPAGSVEAYRTTAPWSDFGTIVAITAQQPLPFLEGNPIWVYKYERLTRGNGLKDGEYYGVHVDTGNRKYSYYFLGGQEEIEGKVYTMMGEVKSDSDGELAVSRWLPVREENGIVYAFTDSLPGLIGYDYLEVPYLQIGKECVLYNFNTEIGESLYPQNEYTKVVSYGTYQLMNGAVCRVLKTTIEDFDLYEKLGYLHDCLYYGVMDPPSELIYPTGGDVRATHLNAYYQNGIMLYKAPEIQEGICVNDTCWSRDDGNAYVRSYKVDPRQEEVFAYIRQLQKANEPVTFTAGQVATIILPVAPDASKGKYYRLDRVEDGQIIFEEEFNPQAHIPYIIVPKEDFSIDLNTLDLAGCYQDTISIAGISFIGSYVSETFDYQEGAYIDIIDTTPDCQYNESCVIGALRAYLLVRWDDPYNQGGTRVPPMNKLEIVLHDYGTGVEDVNLNLDVNHALFDLQGRKVANPRKGIYIKDGRKVLLK